MQRNQGRKLPADKVSQCQKALYWLLAVYPTANHACYHISTCQARRAHWHNGAQRLQTGVTSCFGVGSEACSTEGIQAQCYCKLTRPRLRRSRAYCYFMLIPMLPSALSGKLLSAVSSSKYLIDAQSWVGH